MQKFMPKHNAKAWQLNSKIFRGVIPGKQACI